MTGVFIRIEGVNPEPWTPGTLVRGRFPKMTKDRQLVTYQAAIQELLGAHVTREGRKTVIEHIVGGFAEQFTPLEDELRVVFRLWRRLDTYVAESGRNVTKHRADATNMQKALEDAMQGIVFKNDNQVRHIETDICEAQSKDVEPAIEIAVHPFGERWDVTSAWLPAIKLNGDHVGIEWVVA